MYSLIGHSRARVAGETRWAGPYRVMAAPAVRLDTTFLGFSHSNHARPMLPADNDTIFSSTSMTATFALYVKSTVSTLSPSCRQLEHYHVERPFTQTSTTATTDVHDLILPVSSDPGCGHPTLQRTWPDIGRHLCVGTYSMSAFPESTGRPADRNSRYAGLFVAHAV